MNVTYVRYRDGHPYVVPAGGWRRKSPIHVSTCSKTNKTNEICALRMSGQWRSQRMLWHFFWCFKVAREPFESQRPSLFILIVWVGQILNHSSSPQKVFLLRTCSNMFFEFKDITFFIKKALLHIEHVFWQGLGVESSKRRNPMQTQIILGKLTKPKYPKLIYIYIFFCSFEI